MRQQLLTQAMLSYLLGVALLVVLAYSGSFAAGLGAFFFLAKGGHWEERRLHV